MEDQNPQGVFEYYQKYFLSKQHLSFSGRSVDIGTQEYVTLDYMIVDNEVACDVFSESIVAIGKLLQYQGEGEIEELIDRLIRKNEHGTYDVTQLRWDLIFSQIATINVVGNSQYVFTRLARYFCILTIMKVHREVYLSCVALKGKQVDYVFCIDQYGAVLLGMNQLNSLIYDHGYNEAHVVVPYSLVSRNYTKYTTTHKGLKTLSPEADIILKNLQEDRYNLKKITISLQGGSPKLMTKEGSAELSERKELSDVLPFAMVGTNQQNGKATGVYIHEHVKLDNGSDQD